MQQEVLVTDGLWENNQIQITSLDLVGTENVDYIADAHYLPFKNETFDGVWIQAVLEHVVSPETVVKEIFRVLKNDGINLFRNSIYAANSYG